MPHIRYSCVLRSALPASLILASVAAAQAQTAHFGPDSDVLGLRLSMTRAEAERVLAAEFPGAPVKVVPVKLTLDTVSRALDVALIADLSKREERAALPQPDISPLDKPVTSGPTDLIERVEVLTDLTGTGPILGIYRAASYPAGKQPVVKTLVDALTAKYGPPLKVIAQRGVYEATYVWGDARAAAAKPLQFSCLGEQAINHYPYDSMNEYSAELDLSQVLNSVADGFVSEINNPNFSSLSACGIVLAVHFQYPQTNKDFDTSYIENMQVHYLDYGRTYEQISAFRKSLTDDVEKARQQKLDSDAKVAPKL